MKKYYFFTLSFLFLSNYAFCSSDQLLKDHFERRIMLADKSDLEYETKNLNLFKRLYDRGLFSNGKLTWLELDTLFWNLSLLEKLEAHQASFSEKIYEEIKIDCSKKIKAKKDFGEKEKIKYLAWQKRLFKGYNDSFQEKPLQNQTVVYGCFDFLKFFLFL